MWIDLERLERLEKPWINFKKFLKRFRTFLKHFETYRQNQYEMFNDIDVQRFCLMIQSKNRLK